VSDSSAKQARTPVDATWPQRKRTTKEERSGEGDLDRRIQKKVII